MTLSIEISFVLSGGSTNLDPNASLGGDPSSAPIVDDSTNNLFADVSAIESQTDYVDYRCFYVFNDGAAPIYDMGVWIAEDFEGGAILMLGVDSRNAVQRINVSDTSSGGSFSVSYLEAVAVVEHNSDPGVWATNLQTALNGLMDGEGNPYLSTVQVQARLISGNILFDITFADKDSKRYHPTLTLVSNDLTPAATITITVLQSGSPINTIAPDIGQDTNPPGGVTFVNTTSDAPIVLPRLDAADGFPLWIKRTVASGTAATEVDGVTIRFSAGTLPT